MIHRLLYVSRVAGGHLPSDLEDILRISVLSNAVDGVTGMLICDGVNFAQALEGDVEVVEACFRRIEADARHKDILVRDRSSVSARSFAGWSMCGLYLSDREDVLLAPGDIEFDVRRVAASALWQHLAGLSDRHGAELDAEHARLLAADGAA